MSPAVHRSCRASSTALWKAGPREAFPSSSADKRKNATVPRTRELWLQHLLSNCGLDPTEMPVKCQPASILALEGRDKKEQHSSPELPASRSISLSLCLSPLSSLCVVYETERQRQRNPEEQMCTENPHTLQGPSSLPFSFLLL